MAKGSPSPMHPVTLLALVAVLVIVGCSPPHQLPSATMIDKSGTDVGHPLSRKQHDQLLGKRIVVLDRELNKEVAEELIARMLYLQSEDPHRPMKLFVDSRGGGVAEGFAIIDTMDFVSLPVHTHCYGRADAIAAIIVAHGAKSHRSANRDAAFSLSEPWADQSSRLTPPQLAQELKHVKSQLSETLAADTGRSVLEINKTMAESARFDASEALEYNLVDQIADRCPLRLPAD